ncbi:MAG: amino acid transporter substrate-binding protein family, partial [Alphaproteobacteria bacterium]|nr:amino acid transporter substrate-binding protein family [Alphaproteobacteria bacterium]
NFPKASIVSLTALSGFDQLLLNVSSGKADIVFTEQTLVDDFIKKNPGLLKRVTKTPFQIFNASFPVAMDEVNLSRMMDSAINELHNNGSIDRILLEHGASRENFMRIAQPYQQ